MESNSRSCPRASRIALLAKLESRDLECVFRRQSSGVSGFAQRWTQNGQQGQCVGDSCTRSCFGRKAVAEAIKHNPGHAIAGLNHVEAFDDDQENQEEAIAQATQILAVVERAQNFDSIFSMHRIIQQGSICFEWSGNRGWNNAAIPEAQKQEKRKLLLCWLHSLLGDFDRRFEYFEAAARLRPDLGIFQAAWGCIGPAWSHGRSN